MPLRCFVHRPSRTILELRQSITLVYYYGACGNAYRHTLHVQLFVTYIIS
jgi:hypothetical protein